MSNQVPVAKTSVIASYWIWIVVAFVVILVIIAAVIGLVIYLRRKKQSCQQVTKMEDVPDISLDTEGRFVKCSDDTKNYYYQGYLISPSPTDVSLICSPYCVNGYDASRKTCKEEINSDFADCQRKLTSDTCSGPIPVAQLGGVFYYRLTPAVSTDSTCQAM